MATPETVWGVLGAMPEEIEPLLNEMQEVAPRELAGFRYYSGRLDGARVTAVCCSIGTITAALATQTLIREFGATRIVNLGLAGALRPEIGHLSVVLAHNVAFHDKGAELCEGYPFRTDFDADPVLAAAAEALCREQGYRVFLDRIATGDQFIADAAKKQAVADRLDPGAVDMEGAAVGEAAFLNNTPFLIVRTISDSAEKEPDDAYYQLKPVAARQACHIVRGLIARLP